MAEELDDLPIDPEEATDLILHVRNCAKRHMALVRMIHNDRIITWLYRGAVIPALLYICGKMAGWDWLP